ncbi:MAG: WecB/TagA/CpsF family glycosyltransferase [Candidatus Caldatribacteriaceae bacterium]
MEFLGFSIAELNREALVALVDEALRKKRKMHLVTLNPEMLARQARDARFRAVLLRAEVLVPDGMGIVWGAKFLGKALPGRLPGIELAEALLAEGQKSGWRFYLVGGKEGVAEQAAQRLRKRYPGLQVVGTHHGYFEEDAPVVEAINRANPQVLFLGMGSPRQELWIDQYREVLSPLVFMGVGGSFDVWSGEKKRSPRFLQRLGLEWLWRVLTEPGRLRRVVPAFWRFGILLLRERMRCGWYNGKR